MRNLHTTAHDLASALVGGATFGKLAPVRWVEDADTRKRVGWIRDAHGGVEFMADWRGGWARNETEALQRISEIITELRGEPIKEAA